MSEFNESPPEFQPTGDSHGEKQNIPLAGIELILSQVDRLSELIQKEYDAQEPNSSEDEAEFQRYMREWITEYQRLAALGESGRTETLEVLDMIRTMLGDLPIEEDLLPEKIYEVLPPEGSETDVT